MERGVGGGEGKCVGVCGKVRKDVRGVEKSRRVYGVSGEGCGRVYGERKCVGVWGKECGRCREMCLGVGPQHTFPHLLLHLTFPYISPYLPHTPIHFPTPPSHNSSHISPFSPHTPTHFPTISTSPITFSKCGEVTM